MPKNNKTKNKFRTFATVEDLHDAIRDKLCDGCTTQECADLFRTSVGKCASILAHLNR